MAMAASKVELLRYPSGDETYTNEVRSSIEDNIGEEISLRVLEIGQHAQIIQINASGELGRRIREMGLIPGAEVSVVGRAPLKDPVALRLLGFTLTLRNNEADYITVRVIN